MKIINIHTVGMALLISMMLTGCAERGMRLSQPTAVQAPYASESRTVETLYVNSEVMWGMGKTFDEIAERYGEVADGNYCAYSFENGYGLYKWGADVDITRPRDEDIFRARKSGGCKSIAGISARDLLIGDLSTVNMDNLASKCGFEIVPLDPKYNDDSLYGDHKFAYYTHPSYKNMMFVMCYKKSGFDGDAVFRVRYESGI